jgi:hypothetical protein
MKSITNQCFCVIAALIAIVGCESQSQPQPVGPEVDSEQTGPLLEEIRREAGKVTLESFDKLGNYWGSRLKDENVTVGRINNNFVWFLLTEDVLEPGTEMDINQNQGFYEETESSYYFGKHFALKDSFHKGFRMGYTDRNADMVLGPHITEAAKYLGFRNATGFVNQIRALNERQRRQLDEIDGIIKKYDITDTTEQLFEDTINSSIELFKELIAEGSPADRDRFKQQFTQDYDELISEYLNVAGNFPNITLKFGLPDDKYYKDTNFTDATPQGTSIIYSMKHTLEYASTFSIEGADSVWNHIYRKSLTGVGEEMGDKFAHNLITRTDLRDWLRRAFETLNKDKREEETEWIREGFCNKYNEANSEEGQKVFDGLLNETGQ